ncbi:uncharacterized protein SCALIN_C03_0041 [Candidatus Scalindua japonica]|uniref:Uncharacterized protein n=1 Tax=Candidatus Scalindua japonica TaxID=1284222 RepID=A0A286TU39_9BACT|nr:uncharacterized protein SCALIN_C03_0041 [Candidatus Scalindua japonica]
MITIWPKREKKREVSWTVSPVTQSADVEVNKASTNDVPLPLTVATGSISKIVPITIKVKKLRPSVTPGFALKFLNALLNIYFHFINRNDRYLLSKQQ